MLQDVKQLRDLASYLHKNTRNDASVGATLLKNVEWE